MFFSAILAGWTTLVGCAYSVDAHCRIDAIY